MNFEDFEKCFHDECGSFPSKEEPPINRGMARESNVSSSESWTDMGCDVPDMTGHSRELTLDPSALQDSEDNRLTRSWECPRTTNYYEYEEPHSADFLNDSSAPSPNRTKPDEPDNKEKIKSKLMSAWNNMRHVWAVKTKTNFKVDSTIYLLGKEYPCSSAEREAQKIDIENGISPVATSFDMFLDDFKTRVWLTYRRGFAVLPGSSLNSDVGWGCMIRSGQMMLAQALMVHLLHRGWRLEFAQRPQLDTYRDIVRMFGDIDTALCPFSLHKLIQIGEVMGKKPGDWYGPSSVAYVLRDAVEIYFAQQQNQSKKDFCIYVAQDCTVYKQDVIDMCTYKEMPSQDNSSSSSSNSPATSTKNAHPSPKSKVIVENLDIRRPKGRSVFYQKLGITNTSQQAQSSNENVNIQSDHSDSSQLESHRVTGMCEASTKNGSGCADPLSHSECQSQRLSNGTAEQVSGQCTNGSPRNPLYEYSLTENASTGKSGMERVTSLTEHIDRASVSDNPGEINSRRSNAGQKRFNPFDAHPVAGGGSSQTQSSGNHGAAQSHTSHGTHDGAHSNASESHSGAQGHGSQSDGRARSHKSHARPSQTHTPPGAQNRTPADSAHSTHSSHSPNNSSFLHDTFGGARSTRYPWRPVLVLVPVRLGGLEFNPVYEQCLRRILQSHYSVGIIGGKPKHSLFFVGWQDDKLLYLDPHFCQDHVDVTDPSFPIQSFQCESPRKMSFNKIDPSCTLGFYCRTQADFNNFVTQSEKLASPANRAQGVYPLYVFSEGRSMDVSYGGGGQDEEERRLRLRRLDRHGRPKHRHPSKDSNDDFVML